MSGTARPNFTTFSVYNYLPVIAVTRSSYGGIAMYFRFCGWRQICPQWAVWRHVDTAAATSLQHREGLTPLLRRIDCFVSWRVPWLAESIVQGVLGAKPAMHHWVIGGQWRRNYRDRGVHCTPQVQDLYPLYPPSQRCGLCQNFKQTTYFNYKIV